MVDSIEATRRTLLGEGPSREEIEARIEAEQIRFINLQFTDVMGIVKSVTVPARTFGEIVERGQWFDGSSIAGFTRIAESDMFLVPDLSTFTVIPWEQDEFTTARVICWVHNPNGDPFPGDPRHVLLRQLDRLHKLGFTYNVGPELEFFLFARNGGEINPLPHDRGGYFDLSTDLAGTVRKDMVLALLEMGIDVEAAHHETAPGQHEIDFEYGPAIPTADRAVTFKNILKAIAQKHGLHATFMPKPMEGVAGSGMHVHQSFGYSDGRGGNAFADERDPYGLSALARHFIAGQLHHARSLAAITNPLINSYRRLGSGYEAPVYVAWARTNRSALIRVPSIRQGNTAAARLELRCPDSSTNPYLAFAAMLAAGMDGITQKMEAPEPVEENLYHFTDEDLKRRNIPQLPSTLSEATDLFASNEVIRDALGEHVSEKLIEGQRAEVASFSRHITTWERDRYLERY